MSDRGYSLHKIAEEVVVAKQGCELLYTGAHTTTIDSGTIDRYLDNLRRDPMQEFGRDDSSIICRESDTCDGCITDFCFYILFLRR